MIIQKLIAVIISYKPILILVLGVLGTRSVSKTHYCKEIVGQQVGKS